MGPITAKISINNRYFLARMKSFLTR